MRLFSWSNRIVKPGRKTGVGNPFPLSARFGDWLRAKMDGLGLTPTILDAEGVINRTHLYKILNADVAESAALKAVCARLGIKMPTDEQLGNWFYVLVRLCTDAPDRVDSMMRDALDIADLRALSREREHPKNPE